jgi:hypothetical protein
VTRRLVQPGAAGVAVDAGIAAHPTDGITAVQRRRGAERLHGVAAAAAMIRAPLASQPAGDVSVCSRADRCRKELFAEQLHRLSPCRRRRSSSSTARRSRDAPRAVSATPARFTGAEQARAGDRAADGGTPVLGRSARALAASDAAARPQAPGSSRSARRGAPTWFVYATNRSLPRRSRPAGFAGPVLPISGVAIAIPPLRERRAS